MTGLQMVHVPYKGSGQAVVDVVSGYVSVSALEHPDGGVLTSMAGGCARWG